MPNPSPLTLTDTETTHDARIVSDGDLSQVIARQHLNAWKEAPEKDAVCRRVVRRKIMEELFSLSTEETDKRRIPIMARKLEEVIYKSSLTKEEYMDTRNLTERLRMISRSLRTSVVVCTIARQFSPQA